MDIGKTNYYLLKKLFEKNYENYCNKNIKEKVGEKPDLWLVNRNKILGIVSCIKFDILY